MSLSVVQVNAHQTNSDVQMDSASQQACDAMVCPVAMTEVMKLAAVSYLYHLLCSPSSLANYFSTHYLGANSVIYCIGIHMKIMLVMFVQSSVLNIFHITLCCDCFVHNHPGACHRLCICDNYGGLGMKFATTTTTKCNVAFKHANSLLINRFND